MLLNDSRNTFMVFLCEFQQYRCVHRIVAQLNSLLKDTFQDEEARLSKMENTLTKDKIR